MSNIKKVATGAKWEDIVGYSRAIKIDNTIEISGTTAPGIDEYEQTKAIITIAEKSLKELGADLSNVIRTRMYCINIDQWEAIGKAHQETFGKIRPVTTLVAVSRLISPEILIEIEFTAIVSK